MDEVNYKEKYEKALSYVKDLVAHNVVSKENAGKYFSELAESEDEKIRKELIQFMKHYHTGEGEYISFDKDWISWLEKRKDSDTKTEKAQERIEPKFAVGDVICRKGWSEQTVEYIYLCEDPVYVCKNEDGMESHVSFSDQIYWEKKPKNHNFYGLDLDDTKKVMWLIRLLNTNSYDERNSDPMPCTRTEMTDWLRHIKLVKGTKFKVGDIVISKNNESLTYKIVDFVPCNELGTADYRVLIFDGGTTDGRVHDIETKKMDEWGELLLKD